MLFGKKKSGVIEPRAKYPIIVTSVAIMGLFYYKSATTFSCGTHFLLIKSVICNLRFMI